ncbi:MAG TPA: ATP-binding protein [Burkholderiales bacterium]|nr:ATP-binding protein [Burkholderiales bacterium]
MTEVNLLNCDNEPIHIPGAIQPHGYLFALREGDLSVAQVSANVTALLRRSPEEILDQPAALFFGSTIEARLSAMPLTDPPTTQEFAFQIGDERHHVTAHRYRGAFILELEPEVAPEEGLQATLAAAIRKLRDAGNLAEVMEVAVQEVKRVTGFDRVMVYRFEAGDHGHVVAEAKKESLDSYLDLHYPASDIPRQARDLYRLNPLRLIPKADYEPIELIPARHPDTGGPLDLSFAVLRSVSPIHREYLRNMRVGASMSMSLVVENRLWGLIACLHEEPKLVSPALRDACETIGALLALQVNALTELAFRTERQERLAMVRSLAEGMRDAKEVLDGLASQPKALMTLVGASGAAVVRERIETIGDCPPREHLEALVAWLSQRLDESGVYHTNQLSSVYPDAFPYRARVSGVLAISLPKPTPNLVLWFRTERIHTVKWSGDPNKPVDVEPGISGRLHPRRSFELWKEQVEGQAEHWTPVDLEAALDLRRFAIELDLHRQVLRERAAVSARDDLVAVVSHDLRSPLQAIVLQAAILKRMLGDVTDEKSRRVDHAVDRLESGARRMTTLLQDLLDLSKIEAGRFEINRHPENVNLLIEEACSILRPLAESKSIGLSYTAPQGLYADTDIERIFQVLSNLIGNAIKFTPQDGIIDVVASRRDEEVQFEVRDNGPGIDSTDIPHLFDRYWQSRKQNAKGTGLGLYIARGIVQANGGKIWVESELGHGARFFFTVPVAAAPSESVDSREA